jgi:dTDP-4-dehydrorhamnose reductase
LRDLRPDAVINAAAFTDVDRAETEAAAAFALNRDGPAALARACADLGAPLVHLSTDYVFDGAKPAPYVETDAKAPLNLYGHSKSEGEDSVLASGAHAAIVRTSWVFAAHGRNFLRTMLRLAEARDEIPVVADQIGRPTAASDLAQTCLAVALRALDRDPTSRGVFHYSDAGDASWADFAEAIFSEAAKAGLKLARVKRITTAEFPTPARRPANSRLDSTKIGAALGVAPRDWREACAICVREVLAAGA